MSRLNSLISIDQIERDLIFKPEKYWFKLGERKILTLFHGMSKNVPAYKDFLIRMKIDPDKVKTIDDLKVVPPIDKNNYLRYYPLDLLCWGGEFKKKQFVISATSGSTGEPFYFPRTEEQDEIYSTTAELYLRNNFDIENKTTLYINGFAMGAWIGGVFTYQAIREVALRRKYSLSIITPGIFKEEIIKAVKNLGDKFDQIIIGGYPPMIKDMIDDAVLQGLDWSQYNVGIIFSAEGFTETFRDYIIEKCHLKNVYTSTLNHYGSVDMGTMAHETPISIFIRRLLLKESKLYTHFFKDLNKLPTLAQYNPAQFYFEEESESLYCSSFSGLPLVRYDLKDRGGVYNYAQVLTKLRDAGKDINDELKDVNIGKNIWNLPFVYVYERSDFIVKLYGANIYPETVRKALQDMELLQLLTGKFTMIVKYNVQHNQYLEVNIELKKNITPSLELARDIQSRIVKRLLMENSEYRSNYRELPGRQIPKIILWEYESSSFFKPGVKQKWVYKN